MSLWPVTPGWTRTSQTKVADDVLANVRDCEALILAVPTGPRRDKLTEANIHLQLAHRALLEAKAL